MNPPKPTRGRTWADHIRREAESGRRRYAVREEYESYLNEWKGRLNDARRETVVRVKGTPDWLPYHVKVTKGDE